MGYVTEYVKVDGKKTLQKSKMRLNINEYGGGILK